MNFIDYCEDIQGKDRIVGMDIERDNMVIESGRWLLVSWGGGV